MNDTERIENTDADADTSADTTMSTVIFNPTDPTQTLTYHLPDKTAEVRWPTDQQWIERQRSRKVEVKQLGRGVTDTRQLPSLASSLTLYNQIRTPASPDLDEYEADFVIEALASVNVLDVVREGSTYAITLSGPGTYSATYILHTPSLRQVKRYEETKIKVHPARYSTQLFEIRLEPAAKLFDDLREDPVAAAPIIHKAAVVDALVEDIRASMEGRQADVGVENRNGSPSLPLS